MGQPTFVYCKSLGLTHDQGSLDDVLQFAYVSGPGVRLDQLQGFRVDTPDVLPGFARVAIDEVFDKQGISDLRARKGGTSNGKTCNRQSETALNVPKAACTSEWIPASVNAKKPVEEPVFLSMLLGGQSVLTKTLKLVWCDPSSSSTEKKPPEGTGISAGLAVTCTIIPIGSGLPVPIDASPFQTDTRSAL